MVESIEGRVVWDDIDEGTFVRFVEWAVSINCHNHFLPFMGRLDASSHLKGHVGRYGTPENT